MFAGIDSLIGLLIFVLISVLASWLQKKQRTEEQAPPTLPRRPRAQGAPAPGREEPARQKVDWEEELKRLLEGEPAEPPPPPPPPIVVVSQPRQPAPPPLLRQAETVPTSPEHSPVEVTFTPLPGLTESAQAYAEASTLEEKVQQHLRQVTQKPVAMTHVQHREPSRAAQDALTLLRDRRSVRSAVMASVVLGPPRALAD
jgi:hypothetical protein